MGGAGVGAARPRRCRLPQSEAIPQWANANQATDLASVISLDNTQRAAVAG